FTAEMGGARVVEATFAGGAAKVTVAGQAPKELQTSAVAVIENAVWHHFIFLLEQYDAARGGKQSFTALLPSQATEFSLEVERVESRTFTTKGEQVAVEQYRATTSQNLVLELWADPATRTPLLLRIPAQNARVVRKGWEWLADALAPKAATNASAESEHFSSEEVEFRNGDVTLAATLTVPKKGSAPHPAAVIITGSGGQDRDGTAVFNIYRHVAEALSEAGVAVLRADDRGMGKSRMPQLRAVSYTELAGDTRAAVEYLLTRPDIDRKRIALVGHSEGAQTALTIAADDPRVAAVALLAGTSRSLDHVVVEQSLYMVALQETVDASDRGKFSQVARGIIELFDEVKTKPRPASGEDKLAWFRDHAASDPKALAARVRVPTIILNGERDANVLPYHAVELAEAMTRAGNKNVRLRIFPNLSHMFTPSTLDLSVKPDAAAVVDKGFLETLRRWAVEVLVGK
ncbi:MAG TPA: alpha/beta fold hydrolase, partial [Pyrinomonadaceae bacterium]|nr:alpha/beta fold hydrolase [Pyrinomonadaceae bacterium]